MHLKIAVLTTLVLSSTVTSYGQKCPDGGSINGLTITRTRFRNFLDLESNATINRSDPNNGFRLEMHITGKDGAADPLSGQWDRDVVPNAGPAVVGHKMEVDTHTNFKPGEKYQVCIVLEKYTYQGKPGQFVTKEIDRKCYCLEFHAGGTWTLVEEVEVEDDDDDDEEEEEEEEEEDEEIDPLPLPVQKEVRGR